MKMEKRRLLIQWSEMHQDLRRLVENKEPYDGKIENGKGWSYVTFFPKGIQAQKMLYDIDRLLTLAKENDYYLPREVIIQHNKIVVTAYPEGETPISPLFALHQLLAAYVKRFSDVQNNPDHGFFGKFGGIYDRLEKGRVLAVYSGNDEGLLHIYDSLEGMIPDLALRGVRFSLHLSNGLSAVPRMLHGFDNPNFSRSGVTDYKITDPERFEVLLNQAKQDYGKYPFDEADIL